MPSASRGWLTLAALLVPLATAHGALQVADSVQLIQNSVDAAAHAAVGVEAAQRQGSRRNGGALGFGEASSSLMRRRADPVTDRLLIFWSAGSSKRTIDLVVKNINYARRRFEQSNSKLTRPLQIDVYLAHYDMNKEGWARPMGHWYSHNVQFSTELKGIKFWLAKDLLLWNYSAPKAPGSGGGSDVNKVQLETIPKPNIHSYEYIWFLDEDVDFEGTDLRLMVDLARRSGANIMTPAIIMNSSEAGEAEPPQDKRKPKGKLDSGCQVGDSLCSLQAPSSSCDLRYTNFVEVSFPLMKPETFVSILHDCPACLKHRGTIWGLDRVWCRKSARKGQEERSCAVLDAVPVMHMNYKTLPKWDQPKHSRQSDWDVFHEVQAAEGDCFIDYVEELECVKYPKPDSDA